MLYHAYELQRSWLNSASALASISAGMLNNPSNPFGYMGMGPMVANALDVFAHATAHYGKPAFGITEVEIGGQPHTVIERVALKRPFGDLLHFTVEGTPTDRPRLLIVAPMSGHYATLLRGTVERMLESADVFITDWADAKMVPTDAGNFDLDEYIDYLIEFTEHVHADANQGGSGGPRIHMMAVCQPSVPAFAAVALMNLHKSPATPATLTMMGGPIDTRECPTVVNNMAMQRPIEWFRQSVIATVPHKYPGMGRRVYPGFMQLNAFMSMNLSSHMQSHYEMFKHLTAGDDASAQATKTFYDEYRSVCDMTAEFYLQTVEEVFQKHSIPKGEFRHKGELVDITKITDTALLAIEGERDDISGLGQTKAALKLTPNLPESKKRYYMAEGAGHYGIFNGSRWRTKVAPVVEEWIAAHGG
ncbi:poly(3-hydroxybutyrate) depolymerase [Erythromicrobium ramosum]|uniref:Poly(3-hydroxybutyrate) depolymerase n=1 Tax=Erythrobacter ramosus TaxID=35811 RepID=A0A6I4UH88_9SPHN|nr:polyhydroxyalkanoate depolymerase [Erythrobacter ramosus]MBB3774512.1 poly(3-hydroxybutyrate) depolymerase [Erythrobacter ramosus]MXP37838.1 polyhydroxyalkanoate depolymerase [Erythrobacter ramosus]